jgi:hypothetical protein
MVGHASSAKLSEVALAESVEVEVVDYSIGDGGELSPAPS